MWVLKAFKELTILELYEILKLRNQVFVVEQNCPYQDLDDKDKVSYHIFKWDNNKITAYSRIIPQDVSYKEASIGRVAIDLEFRQKGIGVELMNYSIQNCISIYNCDSIRISAQSYLKLFYERLGFLQTSDEYLEDGIPHIEMLYKKIF